MIQVIATITTTQGRRAEFLTAFRDLVPQVRAEQGCLEYGPTVDVASGLAAQPAIRADVVTVVEKWQDLEALKRHLNAPHMQQFREKAKALLAGLEIQVLAPA
jgi:quinol monooxygenase YgiN